VEESARAYLEKKRWPESPVCPACGANGGRKLTPAQDSKTRKGLYQCGACRRQFTVTVGTLFEDAHTPLHKWLRAINLMCSNSKGISALQIQRDLELGSYRTAWLMCHRIRWALQRPPMSGLMKGAGHGAPASSRRPLRIPLPWDQAVRGLLKVTQEPRDRLRGDRKIGAKMERR
jgi:transposase-like protein